ncbi:MAG TPA: hypothetical protein VHO24_18445 [Opitutaceae bacterium]|nr:hypothetical protein [Opitutaceae bacterium]
MKLVRPLLIGLAVVTVLGVIAVSVAFTSGFQTWAARKALARQPGMQGTIGSVSAGLSRVEAKDVRIVRDGAVLSLPAVEANLPLVSAGMSQKVTITRLVAKGWVLDLTNADPAVRKVVAAPLLPSLAPRTRDFSLVNSAFAADATNPPPASTAPLARIFRGVFAQLQLPVDLSLDGVELEGEVIVAPVPGKPAERLKVIVRGGGLAAGKEGTFTFNCSATAGAGVAPISAQALQGTLTAAMDTPRTFTRLAVKGEASASGTQFPRGVKLNVQLSATRGASGESYVVSLAGEGKQLAGLNVEFPFTPGGITANSKLSGTWKINLRDADLAPFALGFPLPVFETAGEGAFETDAAFAAIHASGKLSATADKLGVVRPELAAMGQVRMNSAFDLARHGDALRVERLTLDLAGEKPVASVRALQAFDFNPKTAELTADPTRDLFGVTLEGVPLAWAQPFLTGVKVSGGDLKGDFVASAGGGGLALRPKQPLTISNLGVTQEGKPLVQAVDLSVNASADYTPQGWQMVIAPFTARSGAATLLTLEAKAGQLAGRDRSIKATGKLTSNFPALLTQPATAGAAQITSGDASLDFSASLGARQEIQARLAIVNLAAAARDASVKLPVITADLRADREADGKITIGLPVLVERDGRKSDLNIAGTLLPDKTGFAIDAHVTSTLLVVEDVQILASPFGAASAAPATPGQPAPRDTTPAWAGLSGKLTLALKRLIYSDTFEVADVTGTLRLEAGAVKLEGLHAGLGEGGEAKANGGVMFDAKATEPYSVRAELVVNNFETGPLFRALDATKAATVEGKFDLKSQLAGSGENLPALMARTHGDLHLISKSGIFRGLRSDVVETIKAAPTALSGLVTGIGSLIGLEKEAAEKAEKLGIDINKRGKLVAEIATALAEIPYDQLSVSLVRSPTLDVKLQEFTLISPEVRLGGTGTIAYQKNVSLLAQALDLRLQLGARGKVADLMKKVSLLGDTQDDLGYAAFAIPVHIGGSLAQTDTGELKKELMKATATSLLNSLMGR